MISCGIAHTVTLGYDGSVWAFGQNDHGQLGVDESEGRIGYVVIPTPVSIQQEIGIKHVSCGGSYTACVDLEGFAWMFGENYYGQLGIGHRRGQRIPTKIPDLPPVLSVHCGWGHTAFIDESQLLWLCGRNNHGQLGLGDTDTREKPTLVNFQGSVVDVACGNSHTVLLNNEGTAYACGYNAMGQLGLGHDINQSEFVKIPGGTDMTAIACAQLQTVCLNSIGEVFMAGQVFASAAEQDFYSSLTLMYGLENIFKLSGALSHFLCVDMEGNLYTFGQSGSGKTGHGTNPAFSNEGRQVAIAGPISIISHGGHHSMVKNQDNEIWVFGDNSHGQLGLGDTDPRFFPEQMSEEFQQIIAIPRSRAKSARK